jgi:hypothetical protein
MLQLTSYGVTAEVSEDTRPPSEGVAACSLKTHTTRLSTIDSWFCTPD